MEQSNKLLSKEQYLSLKAAWKAAGNHDASDHLIYNILRGLPADKGFSPIAEDNFDKIRSNQQDRWNGFNEAKRNAGWKFPTCNQKHKMYDLFHIANFSKRWGIEYNEKYFDLIKEIPRHG